MSSTERSRPAGRLAGKVAIVVGAGSSGSDWGNGSAAAVLFAREGARVLCADLRADAAEATASAIRHEGGRAASIAADASVEADVRRVVEQCVLMFGGIDVLHNNVGVMFAGGVTDLDSEAWDRAFATNFKSCAFGMRHAIPAMRQRGGGAIVNVSSIAAIRHTGEAFAGYATMKAAMNHLTRISAVEHAPDNVRINVILPGLIRTAMAASYPGRLEAHASEEAMWTERATMAPSGRLGSPWDVAAAAVFLASDAAQYITGAELVVDGAATLRL
jgi:NAD(P)-dependent dehydrogenase (short-subunit alcohol dehydrogenase family)